MVWEVNGGRVLTCKSPAVFEHYKTALTKAAEDFVARSKMAIPYTVEGVLSLLHKAVIDPAWCLLLAVDDQWALFGFATLVRVGHFIGEGVEAEVSICYTRPDSIKRALSKQINDSIDAVARDWGARAVTMVSNRDREKGWASYGYHPVGVVYSKELV